MRQKRKKLNHLMALTLIMVLMTGMIPSFALSTSNEHKVISSEALKDVYVTGASEGRILFYDDENLYGYLDYDGNPVIKAQYTYAGLFYDGVAEVTMDDEDVYINTSGDVLFYESDIAKQFDEDTYGPDIYAFSDGLARVETYDSVGFINKQGKFVIPMGKYSSGSDFNDGIARVTDEDYNSFFINKSQEKLFDTNDDYSYGSFVNERSVFYDYGNDQYGVIDENGNIVVKASLDYANDYVGEFALYKEIGKYGVVNKKGEFVLPPTFKDAIISPDGYVAGYDGVYTVFLDSNMQPLNKVIGDNLYNMYDNVYIDSNNDGYTFEDLSGKVLGTFDDYYHLGDYIFELSEGRLLDTSSVSKQVAVDSDLKINTDYDFIYVNNQGEEVIKLKGYDSAEPFSEGLAVVEKNGKFGYINTLGEVVIPLRYISAESFYEGRASVETPSDYLTIDKVGKVIESSYDTVEIDDPSEFVVISEGYYGDAGVANKKTNEIVLDMKYYSVDAVGEGLFELSDDNYNSGFFNANTGVIVEPIFDYVYIQPENNLVLVQDESGLYGAFNTEGEVIIEPSYDYITVNEGGTFELEKDYQYGIANSEGEVIIKPEFDTIYTDEVTKDINAYTTYLSGEEHILVYNTKTKETISDSLTGTVVATHEDFIVLSTDDGKTQVAKLDGEVIFEAGDYFVESVNGYLHFEDSAGMDYLVDSEGKAYLKDNKYDDLHLPVQDGHVIYSLNNEFGLINLQGEVVTKQMYSNVSFIESGIMAFYHEDAFGYVNLKGENIIEPGYYDFLYYFTEDLGLVVKAVK